MSPYSVIDIEWVKLNNIPTCPLSKPILVYNVNGTANNASTITNIADIILHYENHSEHTQLAVTHLGKQSLILGYNWLQNHNPEINWQMKDVKMSHCPLQRSTCRVEDKCDAKIRKSTTSQINACWLGAFPRMAEEDEDESPHVNTGKTDEEVQDTGPALIVKLMTSLLRRMTVSSWRWCIQSILTILSVLRARCPDA
jgi:hypothetical protein